MEFWMRVNLKVWACWRFHSSIDGWFNCSSHWSWGCLKGDPWSDLSLNWYVHTYRGWPKDVGLLIFFFFRKSAQNHLLHTNRCCFIEFDCWWFLKIFLLTMLIDFFFFASLWLIVLIAFTLSINSMTSETASLLYSSSTQYLSLIFFVLVFKYLISHPKKKKCNGQDCWYVESRKIEQSHGRENGSSQAHTDL